MHNVSEPVDVSLYSHVSVNGFGNARGMTLWYKRLVSMQDGGGLASSETAHGNIRLQWLECSQSNSTANAEASAGEMCGGTWFCRAVVPSTTRGLSYRRSVWLHVRWCRLPMRSGLVHILSASGNSVSVFQYSTKSCFSEFQHSHSVLSALMSLTR
jgi:hypothetical protein